MIYISSLYYDLGYGFLEKFKIVQPIVVDFRNKCNVDIEFNLSDLPEEAFAHSFRFDPIENLLLKIHTIQAFLSVFYSL